MKFTIYDLRFAQVSTFRRCVATSGFLFAALSLTLADGQDSNLAQLLVGTWSRGKTDEICILTNGSFHTRMSKVRSNATTTWNYEGKWYIRDNIVVLTLTNASVIGGTNFESIGSVDHMKIIKIDNSSFVWEIDGQTNTFRRKQ